MDAYEAPILHIVSPLPDDHAGADWLEKVLPEAAWVYRDTALLWMTARTLLQAGAIATSSLADEAPAGDHVRCLVDAVYEAPSESLPSDDLRRIADGCRGQGYAKANLAEIGLLNPAEGYSFSDHKWSDDADIATRLEEPPRVAVRLAVENGGRITPLSGEAHWGSNELKVTRAWAHGLAAPDEAVIKRLAPAWAEADASIRLLVLSAHGSEHCSVDSKYGYSARLGLTKIEIESK